MPPGQSLVVVHGWPEDEPPAHMFGRTLPSSPFICPHVPLPIAEVNFSMVGSGVPQAQAVADEHVQISVQTWPAPHPPPQGGSHCSIPALMPLPHRLVVQLESQPSPSTLLPSSHSSPASIVWLPHRLGSVVVVVFAGQSVTRGLHVPCGVHVSVKRSLSTRCALPLPAMPIRVMKAFPGLFFFFPLTLTMKLLATVPHEASPPSEAGAASFLSPLTPLTLANAFFKAVGVQAESPVWLTQSFTAKEHWSFWVASASHVPSQSLHVIAGPVGVGVASRLSSTRQPFAALPLRSPSIIPANVGAASPNARAAAKSGAKRPPACRAERRM